MKTQIKNMGRRIPLIDLKQQYRSIKEEIDSAIKGVIDAQEFIMGREVKLFEEEMAKFCDANFAIGVSSGTDALILSLKAIDIKQGEEVITTPFTFMATAGAITNSGGTPVFCDIDPETYNIDPEEIKRRMSDRTRAIIPVHLYGQCADMDKILEVGRANKLTVIEDCAQAIGATYKGRKAGSMGQAGAISFFPSKNLGAFGDGGMVVTNNKDLASKLKLMREHGSSKKYVHSIVGTNSRLDNLQAAILRVKLKVLDSWAESRRKNALLYNECFKNSGVTTPYVPGHNVHVYHQYIIRVKDSKRDSLAQHLENLGVASRVYYPIPLHLQECYKSLNGKEGDFPHAEEAARTTLAVPVYPGLKEDEISRIADSIKSFLK
ncbi:MAG: DegT/DnrJ/EryC1/StrS family aminotransferase [Candidatus Omnitrophota bacterium]